MPWSPSFYSDRNHQANGYYSSNAQPSQPNPVTQSEYSSSISQNPNNCVTVITSNPGLREDVGCNGLFSNGNKPYNLDASYYSKNDNTPPNSCGII